MAEHTPTCGEPNPLIIDLLESFLADARTGEVQAVAIVAVSEDGLWSSGHVKQYTGATLIGGMELLKAEITDDYLRGEN